MSSISASNNQLTLIDCVEWLKRPYCDLDFGMSQLSKVNSYTISQEVESGTLELMNSESPMHVAAGSYVRVQLNLLDSDRLLPFKIEDVAGSVSKVAENRWSEIEVYQPRETIILLPENESTSNKPSYVGVMPIVLGTDHSRNHKEIDRIITLFETQAFSDTDAKSMRKIYANFSLVLGGNTFKSIDQNRNRKIIDFVTNHRIFAYYNVRFFGFFWNPVWKYLNPYTGQYNDISISAVAEYFRGIQILNPQMAEAFRLSQEELKEPFAESGVLFRKRLKQLSDQFYNTVPYQEIREVMNRNVETQEVVLRQHEANPDRPIYLVTMDPDCDQLRNDGRGLFSHYNKEVKRAISENRPLPTVMTTGYKMRPTAHTKIFLGVELDRNARKAICPHVPLAVNIPEPNMCLLVLPGLNTVKESFIQVERVGKKPKPEARVIIQNMVNQRQLDLATAIRFLSEGAIPTKTPKRFIEETKKGRDRITFANVGDFSTLSAIRSIKQSHVNTRSWAIYMIRGLSLTGSIELKKQLSVILNVFDPIDLTYTHRIGVDKKNCTPKLNFFPTMGIYGFHVRTMTNVMNLLVKGDPLRSTFYNELNESRILQEGCKEALRALGNLSASDQMNIWALFKQRTIKLIEAYKSLIVRGVKQDTAATIIKTAIATGVSIYNTLNALPRF